MDKRMKAVGCAWVMAAALVAGLAGVAQAVDGVVLINQAKALAGNVTPGDTPGFPVTISRPGSYRLEGNLTVPNVDTTAILITADNVTLDLNGFSILAPAVCITIPGTPCPSHGLGVEASDGNNVAVVNGTVRGMGGTGVFVGNNGRVEKVRAVSNGGNGISAGAGSTVQRNMIQGNGGSGIVVGDGGTAQGNAVRGNGGFGLNLGALQTGTGYAHNVLSDNTAGAVNGGTSLGHNLCDGVLC